MPQPFTRSGSVWAARPGTSDWRLVTTNAFWLLIFAAVAGTAPIINNPTLARSAKNRLAMCWTSIWLRRSDRGEAADRNLTEVRRDPATRFPQVRAAQSAMLGRRSSRYATRGHAPDDVFEMTV